MDNNYDWQHIRSLFESGETAHRISRRPGMPTKEGIRKRSIKERWKKPTTVHLPSVAAGLNIRSNLLTDDLLTTVLGMIGEGATQEIACQAAGISARTWRDWIKADQTLQDAVRRARAGKLATWMSHIDRASERDWRAGQWLLQTAPETRETFGKTGQDSKLEIVINIDRSNGTIIDQ